MSQAQGVKGRVGYMIETTLGVVPTPALKTLYFLNESVKESINLVTSMVLRDNRNPTKPVRGNRDVAGGFKTELAPGLGTLLRAALGSVSTSGAESPYTHTIKIGDLPSLTVEKGFSDLGLWMVFPGCKVNRMTLGVKPEGFQEIDFELMGLAEYQVLAYDGQTGNFTAGLVVTGAGGSYGTIVQDIDAGTTGLLVLKNTSGVFVNDEAITDTSTGAAVVNGTLGSASIDASWTDPGHSPFDGLSAITIQEGGSAIATVTGIEGLTIENNLDGGNYVVGGAGVKRSLPDGKVRVSGTLTALFEDRTVYNKAVNYTESSLKIIYQHGTGAGTAGNEYLEIHIPELYYAKETPVIEGPNGVLYRGPFEAFYHNDAGASAMIVTLKNAEATI